MCCPAIHLPGTYVERFLVLRQRTNRRRCCLRARGFTSWPACQALTADTTKRGGGPICVVHVKGYAVVPLESRFGNVALQVRLCVAQLILGRVVHVVGSTTGFQAKAVTEYPA